MSVTVAIVDDDVQILDAIALVLEIQGWCVHAYTNGEAFLENLGNDKPDCVVLDLHLPGISGGEVARSVAGRDDPIPIVALTARPASPVVADAANAGARVVLTKPVTAEELVEHIRAAIL